MSSTVPTEKETLRFPKYNGKKGDYHRWQALFMAIFRQKKMPELLEHLKDDVVTPKDDCTCEDAHGQVDPVLIKIQEQNKKGYAILLSSVAADTDEEKVAFDTVLATADEAAGYADGNFKKAWTNLRDLMEPRTQVTLQKNKEAYNDMKMRFGDDPSVLMTKLKDLRQKMANQGRNFPDEEFIMDVLSKLPASRHKYGDPPYGIKKALIERDIADATKTVTYESVQIELGNRFQELQSEASQTKEKVEVALNAEATGGNNNGN